MKIKLNNFVVSHLLVKGQKEKNLIEKSIKYIAPHYIFNIQDCIHYNSLITNNFEDYINLLKNTKQPEHSLEKFLKLKEEFNLDKLDKIECLYDSKLDKFIVLDGVHRMSILLFLGYKDIDIKYINIRLGNDLIKNLNNRIKETTTQIKLYNNWNNTYFNGYHSFDIYNFKIKGQRDPKKRLEIFKNYYDFTDKKVLDLGCNTGGMLFHLQEIKEGLGIDYDSRCLNFANYLKNILKYDIMNFEKQDLNNYLIKDKFDIIFLLSLGSWVKNWKKLYSNALEKSNVIFLEINNIDEGKPQLNFFKEKNCLIKEIIEKSIDDITNNHKRKTYLIKIK